MSYSGYPTDRQSMKFHQIKSTNAFHNTKVTLLYILSDSHNISNEVSVLAPFTGCQLCTPETSFFINNQSNPSDNVALCIVAFVKCFR